MLTILDASEAPPARCPDLAAGQSEAGRFRVGRYRREKSIRGRAEAFPYSDFLLSNPRLP